MNSGRGAGSNLEVGAQFRCEAQQLLKVGGGTCPPVPNDVGATELRCIKLLFFVSKIYAKTHQQVSAIPKIFLGVIPPDLRLGGGEGNWEGRRDRDR
jgi:hypothetical protein